MAVKWKLLQIKINNLIKLKNFVYQHGRSRWRRSPVWVYNHLMVCATNVPLPQFLICLHSHCSKSNRARVRFPLEHICKRSHYNLTHAWLYVIVKHPLVLRKCAWASAIPVHQRIRQRILTEPFWLCGLFRVILFRHVPLTCCYSCQEKRSHWLCTMSTLHTLAGAPPWATVICWNTYLQIAPGPRKRAVLEQQPRFVTLFKYWRNWIL